MLALYSDRRGSGTGRVSLLAKTWDNVETTVLSEDPHAIRFHVTWGLMQGRTLFAPCLHTRRNDTKTIE